MVSRDRLLYVVGDHSLAYIPEISLWSVVVAGMVPGQIVLAGELFGRGWYWRTFTPCDWIYEKSNRAQYNYIGEHKDGVDRHAECHGKTTGVL